MKYFVISSLILLSVACTKRHRCICVGEITTTFANSNCKEIVESTYREIEMSGTNKKKLLRECRKNEGYGFGPSSRGGGVCGYATDEGYTRCELDKRADQ
jgi:hypothetical protein